MARITVNRQRDLQQDAFRDTTLDYAERLGNRLEGRGRTILYIFGALILAAILLAAFNAYNKRQAAQAQTALGRAIEIASVQVTPSPAPPVPNSTLPTFSTEKERAERAVQEFNAVAQNYGSPYKDIANYLAATNRLTLDRTQGINELQALTTNSNAEVAASARFALAEARAADGQYDQAATLYRELVNEKNSIYAKDTLNLRLANVLEKQGKQAEAADLLFKIVKEARENKGADGKPVTVSAAAREAATKLQELDANRFAQLPPEPITNSLF